MTMLVGAGAGEGFTAGLDLVPVALRDVRARMLDVCDNLGVQDWQAQSRCELWSVHDVVRHVRDVCRIHGEGLRREPTPLATGVPFDARETPRRWLEATAGQAPMDSLRELRELGAAEAPALDARLSGYTDDIVAGPYGPIHWTVLTAHVFWDAWLHDRDVTEVVGGGALSSPVEDQVMALYTLLIASMPAARMEHHFDLTVALTGGDGQRYAVSVVPGSVTLRAAEGPDDGELHGELGPVVDALAGRGPELEHVLHGPRPLLEPLTWMRGRLRPAS